MIRNGLLKGFVLSLGLSMFYCSDKSVEGGTDLVKPPAWESIQEESQLDTLKVASLNMFVGFNVPQLLLADMSKESVVYKKSIELLADFKSSKPELRLVKMAELILEQDLDVVGMQEVTDLYSNDTLIINYTDFLLEKLKELDPNSGYAIARQRLNDIRFKAKNESGDSSVNIRFIEGNAYLYKKSLTLKKEDKILFTTGLPDKILMDTVISIERGFHVLTLERSLGDKKRTFQFFNTHLEVIPSYSKPQADELLTEASELLTDATIQVLIGDMNETPSAGADTIFKAGGFIDT